MTWNTEPWVTSAALIGRPLGSRVSRRIRTSPPSAISSPHSVCARSSRAAGRGRAGGPGPGSGKSASAPSRELRISGRRPMPDSSPPVRTISTASARTSSEPRSGVALLDDLAVGHQGLGPVHGADADEEQRDRHADADAEGGRLDRGEGVLGPPDEVGDDREQGAQRRQREQQDDLALGALGGGGVGVGQPVPVRRQAGVLERWRAARRRRRRRPGRCRSASRGRS